MVSSVRVVTPSIHVLKSVTNVPDSKLLVILVRATLTIAFRALSPILGFCRSTPLSTDLIPAATTAGDNASTTLLSIFPISCWITSSLVNALAIFALPAYVPSLSNTAWIIPCLTAASVASSKLYACSPIYSLKSAVTLSI